MNFTMAMNFWTVLSLSIICPVCFYLNPKILKIQWQPAEFCMLSTGTLQFSNKADCLACKFRFWNNIACLRKIYFNSVSVVFGNGIRGWARGSFGQWLHTGRTSLSVQGQYDSDQNLSIVQNVNNGCRNWVDHGQGNQESYGEQTLCRYLRGLQRHGPASRQRRSDG